MLFAALLLCGALSCAAPEKESEAVKDTTTAAEEGTESVPESSPEDTQQPSDTLPLEQWVMKAGLRTVDGAPVYTYGEKGAPGYEEADYTSLYAEWGKDVTIADVREDPDTGLAYIIRGSRYTLGLDFLSKAMIWNTEPAGKYKTEEEVYEAWWRYYVARFNALLPEIPLCEETAAMLYRTEVSGPERFPLTPERSLSEALLYWETAKENGIVTVALSEASSGLFRYPLFGTDVAAAPDVLVSELTNGLEIISTAENGRPVWNSMVVESHEETENEDGSRTYTVRIREGLHFSDGSDVTARDYLAFPLAFLSAVGAEADPSFPERFGLQLLGADAFRSYEGGRSGTGVFEGVRLLDDHTFSLTVPATELPDANILFSLRLTAQYAPMWLQDAEILDDGEGCYLSEAFYERERGKGFVMAEHLKKTAEDPAASKNYPYSGPYAILHASETVVLRLNAYFPGNFRGRKPSSGTLVVKTVSGEEAFDQLRAGTTDIFTGIEGSAGIRKAQAFAEESGGAVKAAVYGNGKTDVLHFRADLGPVQFLEVRQALALLLDRQALSRELTGGFGIVPDGPYTNNALYRAAVRDGLRLQSYETDAEKARELLEAGGGIYNSKGEAYQSGVRYKKIPAELLSERNRNYAASDGTVLSFEKDGYVYMPLAINYYALEDTELTEALSLIIKEGAFASLGMHVSEKSGTFPQAMDELTESAFSGYYDGTPLMCAFDALKRDYANARADGSFRFTPDPDEFEVFSQDYFRDPADIIRLKMK